MDGLAVLLKHPTDPRAFWAERCRQEICAYQALAADCPVPAPRLIAADPHTPFLIVTCLPGHVLHRERYPTTPVSTVDLAAYLALLNRLHHWSPAHADAIPDDSDLTHHLVEALNSVVAPTTIRHVASCCRRIKRSREVSHGDAHPGNALLLPTGGLAMLDLEFLAWRTSGYDWAKLWIYLADSPGARPHIERHTGTQNDAATSFWASVALVAARELRSHHRHTTLPHRQQRIRHLTADLHHALTRLDDITTTTRTGPTVGDCPCAYR